MLRIAALLLLLHTTAHAFKYEPEKEVTATCCQQIIRGNDNEFDLDDCLERPEGIYFSEIIDWYVGGEREFKEWYEYYCPRKCVARQLITSQPAFAARKSEYVH